jgi:hypothetical protein
MSRSSREEVSTTTGIIFNFSAFDPVAEQEKINREGSRYGTHCQAVAFEHVLDG